MQALQRPEPQRSYASVKGIVISMKNLTENGDSGGCFKLVGVLGSDGKVTQFRVTPDTYFIDFIQLFIGARVECFYDADAPAILIFPPQFTAQFIAADNSGVQIFIGRFNRQLISSGNTLKLNLSGNTEIVTMNNQIYTGNISGREVIVIYGPTTRSIPPQTTPYKVIVLCR